MGRGPCYRLGRLGRAAGPLGGVGVAGQVLERDCGRAGDEGIGVGERREKRRDRGAGAAGGEGVGGGDAHLAVLVLQRVSQRCRGRTISENGQSLCGGNLNCIVVAGELLNECRYFLFAGGKRPGVVGVQVHRGCFAEAFELQVKANQQG